MMALQFEVEDGGDGPLAEGEGDGHEPGVEACAAGGVVAEDEGEDAGDEVEAGDGEDGAREETGGGEDAQREEDDPEAGEHPEVVGEEVAEDVGEQGAGDDAGGELF